MVIALPSFISLLSLLFYHLGIISINETTNENVRRSFSRRWGAKSSRGDADESTLEDADAGRVYANVWDRGPLRNFWSVLLSPGGREYHTPETGGAKEEPPCTYLGRPEGERYRLPDLGGVVRLARDAEVEDFDDAERHG
jgi:hypothetical protein